MSNPKSKAARTTRPRKDAPPRAKAQAEANAPAVAPGPPRRRALLGALIALALCAVIAVGVVLAHYRSYTTSPIPHLDAERVVVISEGASFDTVVQELEAADLVTRPLYFKVLARRQQLDRRIKAGTYRIPAHTNPIDLLAMLAGGGADAQVKLTIPEGFNIYKIADRLEELGLANRMAFLDRVQSAELRRKYNLRHGDSLEGYLFPDTYLFRQGTSIDNIIDRMVQRHRAVWAELVEELGEDHIESLKTLHGLDQHGLMTLASIVEKETRSTRERPIIAQVFYNRLSRKMKLQTDPTCVYGPATYLDKPHPSSCRDKANRYSTYVIEGLPPGPIANPGRASLRAVLEPTTDAKHRDYLYFVTRADGSGRHTFSKTYKDHQKAIKTAFGK